MLQPKTAKVADARGIREVRGARVAPPQRVAAAPPDTTAAAAPPTKRRSVSVPLVKDTEYSVHSSSVESSSSATFDPIKSKITFDYTDTKGTYLMATISPRIVMERLGYSVSSVNTDVAKSVSVALKATEVGVQNGKSSLASGLATTADDDGLEELRRWLVAEIQCVSDRVARLYTLVKKGGEQAEYKLELSSSPAAGSTLDVSFFSLDLQSTTGVKKLFASSLARAMWAAGGGHADADAAFVLNNLREGRKTVVPEDEDDFKVDFGVYKTMIHVKLPSDVFTKYTAAAGGDGGSGGSGGGGGSGGSGGGGGGGVYTPLLTLKLPRA